MKRKQKKFQQTNNSSYLNWGKHFHIWNTVQKSSAAFKIYPFSTRYHLQGFMNIQGGQPSQEKFSQYLPVQFPA